MSTNFSLAFVSLFRVLGEAVSLKFEGEAGPKRMSKKKAALEVVVLGDQHKCRKLEIRKNSTNTKLVDTKIFKI